MKRTFITSLACIAFSTMLTGCDLVPSLNLTEEQSTLIAEYAAGKLLEYAKGHPGGLMILEDIDLTEVNPGLKKEEEKPETPLLPEQPLPPSADSPVSEPAGDALVNEPDGGPDQEALVDTPDDVSSAPTKTIAQALGMDGVDLEYERYEIAKTYPENATELAFSMKAAPGKELLVVHFVLANHGESEVQAHTDSSNFKVRLLLNGSDKLRGDVTFLDNDLMNYTGALAPGAEVDSVLVFEVKEGTEISSMDLLIVEDGGEEKYKIM